MNGHLNPILFTLQESRCHPIFCVAPPRRTVGNPRRRTSPLDALSVRGLNLRLDLSFLARVKRRLDPQRLRREFLRSATEPLHWWEKSVWLCRVCCGPLPRYPPSNRGRKVADKGSRPQRDSTESEIGTPRWPVACFRHPQNTRPCCGGPGNPGAPV